jgi:hypothetical protein
MVSPINQPESAPFNGPQSLRATLLSAVMSAPYEGLWTPVNFMKIASIEAIDVGAESFSITVVGTNADPWPMNTYNVTVAAASITPGDILTLTFTPALSYIGAIAAAYTVVLGDNPASIAAGLAAAINATATLTALGIMGSSSGAVCAVQWPSASQANLAPSFYSPSNVPIANFLALSGAVSAAATESLTITTGTDGSPIANITAPGLIPLNAWPCRYIKARLINIAGSGASVSANFHGVA